MEKIKIKIEDFEYLVQGEVVGVISETQKEFILNFKKNKFPKFLENGRK